MQHFSVNISGFSRDGGLKLRSTSSSALSRYFSHLTICGVIVLTNAHNSPFGIDTFKFAKKKKILNYLEQYMYQDVPKTIYFHKIINKNPLEKNC